jgi:hypothetical protein
VEEEWIEAVAHGIAERTRHLKPSRIIVDLPVGPPGMRFAFAFVVVAAAAHDAEDLEDRIAWELQDPRSRVSVWIVEETEWQRSIERPAHVARHVHLHGRCFDPNAWYPESGAA